MSRLACVLVAVGSLAGVADAQEPGGAAPGREQLLFYDVPTVFSATRTERSLRDIPNAVTVITAEEIRDSGAISLIELLQNVPGLDVLRVSVGDTNMSARGFNGTASSNLLVMIDGRSTYLDFFGAVIWDQLNVALQDIERIEVIRGPGSSLYGANAFLGTINIVTKQIRDLPELYTRFGGGPEAGLVTTTAARSLERSAIKASVQYRAVDHFRNLDNVALDIVHDRQHNGLRNKRLNVGFDHEFHDGSELQLKVGSSDHKADILTGLGTFAYQGPIWFAELDYERGPWRMQAWANRLDTRLFSVPSAIPPTILGIPVTPVAVTDRLVSNVADVELQREFERGSHHFLLGGNVRRISTSSPDVLGSRETETLYAGFVHDEYRISDRFTAFLGARFDDHPTTDVNISPRGGLVVKLGELSRLRLGISRSFRNPTQIVSYSNLTLLGDLGGGPIPLIQLFGNDRIDPAEVTSYEAGFQALIGSRLNVSTDLFFQVVDDFADLVQVGGPLPVVLSFQNSGRMKAWGGELALDMRWSEALRGFANYSFQSATGPLEGITPRHKASGGVRGDLGSRFRYALTGNFVSHSVIESGTLLVPVDDDIPSRFTVDGFLGIRLHPRFELGLHARNLFHQARSQVPGGDEIGSELLVTGTIEF